MDRPVIADTLPRPVRVEAGRTYRWCACGRSRQQPFCDGAHAGTGLQPVEFRATTSRYEFFCTCKHSAQGPLCDGTHNRLPERR